MGEKAEKKRRKRSAEDLNIRHPIFQGLSAVQLSDPQEIVNAFKQAEQTELVCMREVRARNMETGSSQGAACLLDCELCRDKFTPASVPLPRAGQGKRERPNSLRDIKLVCPGCLRSRRPRLETILSLLVSLQKLTVRLPEGEALQCLTERAMAWQDRARTLLGSPELATALAQVSVGRGEAAGEEGETSESEAEEETGAATPTTGSHRLHRSPLSHCKDHRTVGGSDGRG